MAKQIDNFFDELLNDEEAKRLLEEKQPQTVEDLAQISGGLAERLGFDLSEKDILSLLNERLSNVRGKSDLAAERLSAMADSDMEAVAAGQGRGDDRPPMPMPECGLPQLAEILKKIKEYGENH